MKNIVIVLVVVALLAAGGWYYMNMNQAPADLGSGTVETGMPVPGTEGVNEMEVNAPKDVMTGQASGKVAASVKEFTVEGGKFYFAPTTFSVKKGDTVRVTFVNKDGFHDFVIDEFNVKTKQINGGEKEVIEFVADTAGSFEYYCSVGTHRAMGMKGTLVVTE